jgi:hypothetical protein
MHPVVGCREPTEEVFSVTAAFEIIFFTKPPQNQQMIYSISMRFSQIKNAVYPRFTT